MAFESGWDDLMRQGMKTLTNNVKAAFVGVVELTGSALKTFGELASAPATGSRSANSEGLMARMRDAMGLGDDEPEKTKAREPEKAKEIVVAKVDKKMDIRHVDEGKLGTFSSPTFGTGGRSNGGPDMFA